MYTEKEILDEIQKAADNVSGPLTKPKFDEQASISITPIRNNFGTWNNAKEAAGLETLGRYQRPALSNKDKRRRIQQIKEHSPCSRCKENFPPVAMDFHHRENKEASVSRMVTYSWDNIAKELKKCDVVCANCHRIIEHSNNI